MRHYYAKRLEAGYHKLDKSKVREKDMSVKNMGDLENIFNQHKGWLENLMLYVLLLFSTFFHCTSYLILSLRLAHTVKKEKKLPRDIIFYKGMNYVNVRGYRSWQDNRFVWDFDYEYHRCEVQILLNFSVSELQKSEEFEKFVKQPLNWTSKTAHEWHADVRPVPS